MVNGIFDGSKMVTLSSRYWDWNSQLVHFSNFQQTDCLLDDLCQKQRIDREAVSRWKGGAKAIVSKNQPEDRLAVYAGDRYCFRVFPVSNIIR